VPYAIWEDGVGLSQKTFAQIVTFTRASTATYFNSAGTLTSAAVDEARFDYDPSTLAAQGLLIEESRTNSIRNNTMVGAVAGTPGTLPTNWSVSGGTGLTREIVGTGTFNGVTYIDIKLSGSSSASFLDIYFETTNGIAAVNGQTWSAAYWVQVVAGSLTNVSSVNLAALQFDSVPAALGSTTNGTTSASIGSTWQRITRTHTTNNAATAYIRPYIAMGLSTGVAIDITLRIGLPQLELGAFATSVIPTTTTALTRSADVALVNTLSPWFNATEGTLFAESSVNYTVPATFFPLAASLNDNSSNNRIEVGYLTTVVAGFEVSVGGVFQAGLYPSTVAQVRRTAGAYAANDFAVSLNGSAPTTDTSGSIPSVTRLALGTRTSGGTVIHLRRITYYPRRLSNADLQTITT
jgi:hypothetical protein